MESKIDTLAKILKDSTRAVFFGGAGMSTESGIPDFRSADGIYNQNLHCRFRPEEMASHSFLVKHPEEFFAFYRQRMMFLNATPNAGHKALVRLEQQGILKAVVTQNIDGLHELAGSHRVIPVHGTIHSYTCTGCGRKATLDEIPHHGVPMCPICHAPFKPDVVLYGEPLGEEELMGAKAATEYADALIVGGTSLQVYPINALPRLFSGSLSILINRDETPLDDRFDFVIHEDVGTALSAILEGL